MKVLDKINVLCTHSTTLKKRVLHIRLDLNYNYGMEAILMFHKATFLLVWLLLESKASSLPTKEKSSGQARENVLNVTKVKKEDIPKSMTQNNHSKEKC